MINLQKYLNIDYGVIMSSPVLGANVINDYNATDSKVMTISGTISATLILTGILVIFGMVNAYIFFSVNPDLSLKIAIGGAIAALIIALIITFKKNLAPTLSLLYAALEGLTLGGISASYSSLYQGIVIQAVSITVLVLIVMLALYAFRIIKVTAKLRSVIISATLAVAILYLVSFGLSFFGVSLPFLQGNSLMAIGINMVIAGIASFNLLLDFDFIEKGSEQNMPKYFEWYAGFGLLVTLVWLYLEILKLLSKLRKRN